MNFEGVLAHELGHMWDLVSSYTTGGPLHFEHVASWFEQQVAPMNVKRTGYIPGGIPLYGGG
jgi:hypothetical protein